MDPKNIRAILNTAAIVLSVATALVTKLQEIDFTQPMVAIGGVALAIGYAFGKAQEAPGGVPKWKIPSHLHKHLEK